MSIRLIKRMCKQKAIYWAPVAPSAHGKMTFASPVALKVRWSDVQKQFLDEDGNKRLSMAKVFTIDDVKPLGVLWLSSKKASESDSAALAEIDQTNTLNPFLNAGAYEIRKFMKIPTISARQYVRISML